MVATEEAARGPRVLELVTRLQQQIRLQDPTAGVWEAADFQWWWRRSRPTDHIGQDFWLDDVGAPVAAVVFTGGDAHWQCDVLVVPGQGLVDSPLAWQRAFDRMRSLDMRTVEVAVADDDGETIDRLVATGFVESGSGASCWLDADDRPELTLLPEGLTLKTRAEDARRPHHLIARNNLDVEARLSQLSLYRPDLDLRVETPGGEVAGYGLFWADPVTGVGLVEPMRTEATFERRGIARHVLTSGLELLAASGCRRLKVGSDLELYTSVGFARVTGNKVLCREGPWL